MDPLSNLLLSALTVSVGFEHFTSCLTDQYETCTRVAGFTSYPREKNFVRKGIIKIFGI